MNIEFSWGALDEVNLAQVEPEQDFSSLRCFLGDLSLDRQEKLFDLYICADQQNSVLRSLIDQLGNVRVFSSVGNVVFNQSRRPAVIFAHGPHCGAIDYVRKLTMMDSKESLELPDMVRFVADGILGNARQQIARIDPELRAGIIYFDHELGQLELYCNDEESRPYAQDHIASFIFQELDSSLKGRFTPAQLAAHAAYQNPKFTLVCPPRIRPCGYNHFEINFQNGYEFHGIIRDSITYSISRALADSEQSFSGVRGAILAFTDEMRDDPGELLEVIESEKNRLIDYMGHGGSIYCVMVGHLPSAKRIYCLRSY